MSEPTRWRKKPVEIEAMQWNPDTYEALRTEETSS